VPDEQALADFSRVIELEPNAADAYYNRGVAYYEQGDHEQAARACARAIELDPELGVAYFYHVLARAARVEMFDSAEIIAEVETALALGLPPHMDSQARDILAELKPKQADCRFVTLEAMSEADLPTFKVEIHGPPVKLCLWR
jgi:tetratricopeptide (TPR) repeat protein